LSIDNGSEDSEKTGERAPGFEVERLLAIEDLGLRLQAGGEGLSRLVLDAEVQKPGLVLAGMQPSHPHAVHVLGRAENEYLSVRGQDEQRRVLMEYVGAGVPCVVVCHGIAPSRVILEVAEQEDIPVFSTLIATGPFMRSLHSHLLHLLSPVIELHGVLVQVHDVGVLLTGESGIGKSETALELMLRGHRLVADDRVRLHCGDKGLEGTGHPVLGHYMEIRGLGVLHAGDLYGHASVVENTKLDMEIELVDWSDEAVDRTGLEARTRNWIGVDLPLLRLPVRPGRSIATIVEVAARNFILRSRGIHSAQRYADELQARLQEEC
jgi:HPr kinase/phosphorylase